VCALHAVGRSAAVRHARPPDAHHLVEKQLVSIAPAGGSAPQRYHEATKLVPGTRGRPPASEVSAASETSGPDVALGDAAAPDMPLEQAIQLRRSALHFRRDSAGRAALAFVLEAARGHPTARRADEIDLLAAVHRVDGVPAGLYRIAKDGRRLRLQQPGDLGEALVRACGGQEKAGEAAVGLAMVGRIAQAAERRGDRGYRDLLVEAGAIAQRVYLAAEAVGLAARNLAAFRDDELNELLGLDGVREAVVHLTMFGPGD
jgi:SagB-type dehydrogenase family enzyme